MYECIARVNRAIYEFKDISIWSEKMIEKLHFVFA
jgi:hypothetical protein